MRKIAKFTALTTLALASSNLAYADTTDTHGLRVFGSLGAGLVVPSLHYQENTPAFFGTAEPTLTQSNTNAGDATFLIGTGMRYYFDRWILGAVFNYNPISTQYLYQKQVGSGGTSTTSQQYITSNDFFDVGAQLGFRATPNVTFLASVLGAEGSFTFRDNTAATSSGAILANQSSTWELPGVGFGLGAEYRFEQHFLFGVNYRYLAYNTAGNATIRTRSTSAFTTGTASFKPTQSMIDLSLVAEF